MSASRKLFVPCLSALVLLISPAAAQAADTFVDVNSGNDANECTTTAAPCATIQAGVTKATAGATVRVDGGAYAESVSLDDGKSLIEQDFNTGDGDTQATIDGGGASAITVSIMETAGTIQGFTLGSTATAVNLGGPASSITGNTFDSTADNSTGVSVNNATAGASTIGPNNTFSDGNAVDTERRFGVSVASGSPTISGNTFSNLSVAIFGPGSGVISGNTITGTHTASGQDGRGIVVLNENPTIVANHIHSPDPDTASIGIGIEELGSPTGATMRRNRILGHTTGLFVFNTTNPVTLNSDALAKNGTGINAQGGLSGQGNVTATNLTVLGTGQDINLGSAAGITLDSAIVGNGIDVGTGVCVISNSRGPTMTPGGNGCADYQTTADPMLAPDGYHLLAGSPMIDAGNTAAPLAPNDLDVDGDPRALDGTPACGGNGDVARRDIGADEFVAPPPTGCDPPVQPPALPGDNRNFAAYKVCLKKAKKIKVKKKKKKAIKKCKAKFGF